MFAIEAKAPVLIERLDFDKRLRSFPRPLGLLVLVMGVEVGVISAVRDLGSFNDGGGRGDVEWRGDLVGGTGGTTSHESRS